MVLATVGLLLVSNVGLASVSDGAAPGDFLYPLDRGYEWAGDRFGAADRTLERLTESVVLTQRGEADEAIELLRSELATPSSDNDLIAAAIEELETEVQRGNEGQGGNQGGQGNQGGNTVPSSPAATAPGQMGDEGGGPDPDRPSATAPGRIKDDEGGDNPGNDPPDQTKDNQAKDNQAKDPEAKGKEARDDRANFSEQDKDKPKGPPPASNLTNGNNGNGGNGNNGS